MYAVFTEQFFQTILNLPSLQSIFIESIPVLISSVSTRVPTINGWNIRRKGFVYSVLGGAKLSWEGLSRNPGPVTEVKLFPSPGLWLLDQRSDLELEGGVFEKKVDLQRRDSA